ncbi:MAG TPA: glycoside hydrolase domain-containing protein, partial [Gemmatimonadales bacterium]|nr:glycoside hydrolase domain-containing protein [Gemmatimonadales bacterium]
MIRNIALLVITFLAAATSSATAQEPAHSVARWNPDSFGNHRVVLTVAESASAVRAHIPWRRRDRHPETKQVLIYPANRTTRVRNVRVISSTQMSGDIAFEPTAGAGEYWLYDMPYTGTVKSNYPKITYPAADSTASQAWLTANHLGDRDLTSGRWRSLPAADVLRFEAADSMDVFYPMEEIASPEEVAHLRASAAGAPFLLFPEDRLHAIRMRHQLPHRWAGAGPNQPVQATAERGEFLAFQLGLWALDSLDHVTVSFDDLTGPGGRRIGRGEFSSFNTHGVNWRGEAYDRDVMVAAGNVQPLWCGVLVPDSIAAGEYRGSVTVTAAGHRVILPIQLTVRPELIADHGDDEPWRLSRLRWLDSKLALDTGLVKPYTSVAVHGTAVSILGRRITLAPSGLPAQIESFFSSTMTEIGDKGRAMLAAPIAITVTGADSAPLTWKNTGVRMLRELPGAAVWQATSQAGDLTMQLQAELDFDGAIEYEIGLVATRELPVVDVALDIPLRGDVVRYLMGMNEKGGRAPDTYDWQWNVKRNQDAAWLGDVSAGVQFTLKDNHYVRPLNTNFYQLRPLVMPESWDNGGKGRCHFAREGREYRVRCTSGSRTFTAGDTVRFDLRLLITPFHPINPSAHFATRFFHAYEPIDTVRAAGANVINVHHATDINPFINYPFLRPRAMKAYIDSAHSAGMRVKIYYTVRELTNRAPELWALRSLGTDVLAGGPGGGHSWLQEHVVENYIPGWVVPERRDVALVTSGISRWHNHYVEGLDWLARHVGIDGLYLDDVAFDRITMQRIRRVLERNRPAPLIDLHSANQYNPNDGFASSANLYLEHFPYIDRLWFGEYFDYNSPPDYWLVEMSGIPFGLMGEMLQDGGNPWRGMLFGMTARLPWAG